MSDFVVGLSQSPKIGSLLKFIVHIMNDTALAGSQSPKIGSLLKCIIVVLMI